MGLQQHWAFLADSNDAADSAINLRENQAPSTYNNASRAIMAAVAKAFKDIAGGLATSGSSTAYTLTTNEVYTALVDGMFVAARVHTTSGADPTLNVDGRGAVAIQSESGTALKAGDLIGGAVWGFVYRAAGPAWMARGKQKALTAPTGTIMIFGNSTVPTGWVKDTTYDGAALRLTSGDVGDGGTLDFDTALGQRTIAQANLPSLNWSVSDPGHLHPLFAPTLTTTNGSSTNFDYLAGGFSSGSPAGTTQHAFTGIAVGSGGSGTAIDFRVKYAKVTRGTKS